MQRNLIMHQRLRQSNGSTQNPSRVFKDATCNVLAAKVDCIESSDRNAK